MHKQKVLHVQVKAMLSGVQNMSLTTIEALKSTELKFHLITGEPGELTFACDELDVNTYVINSLKREISFLNDVRSILAIRKYIKENDINIVHSHSTKPGVLCRVLSLFTPKVKFVHTVHGTVYSPWYLVRGAIYFMELLLSVLGSRTIVMRRLDLKYISFFGFNKKVIYLRNPIFLAPKVGEMTRIKRLVFIGRLEYQKNPLEFMKLCHLLKDQIQNVLVIGDGSLRSSMEAYAKQEKLNCDFLGWNSDPWSKITSGDVLVCTSLYEGMPLVVLEALSRDVPVIAKEIPGVNDIFTDFRPLFMYRDLKDLQSFTFDIRSMKELHLFNQKVLESGLYDASFRASQVYKGLL
jgi:glycosyltransferase involved in cell wall biosynthesis